MSFVASTIKLASPFLVSPDLTDWDVSLKLTRRIQFLGYDICNYFFQSVLFSYCRHMLRRSFIHEEIPIRGWLIPTIEYSP
jgi:hypothetical protein